MSLLNRPSDGLFNAMLVLYRCVLLKRRVSPETLVAMCAPEPCADPRMVKQILNRCLSMGLFRNTPSDDEVALAEEPPTRDPQEALEQLPRLLRKLIFAESQNVNFWKTDAEQCSDFTRAIAWLLAQEVYTFPGGGYEAAAAIEQEQFPAEDERPLQNNTRWAGLKAWAAYLGFGWNSPFDQGFIIDPTPAVREALPQVFEDRRELDQGAFFSRLAEALPVVDGGHYRNQVEQYMSERGWKQPPAHTVSSSLSRALLRLSLADELVLGDLADPLKYGRRLLLGCGHREIRGVTHLIWKRKDAEHAVV
jgi:hypothetical protein